MPAGPIMRGALRAFAVALAVAGQPASGAAPAAEAGAVTVVVPFAAGGPTDAVARALARAMTAGGGAPVRVENRPGAGGTRGAAEVSRAPPDGRTLLLHHIGMATAPALYRSLPFEPRRDFAPIGRVVDVPMVVVVPAGSPLAASADRGAALRRTAGALVVAYAGPGAASHLCGLLLASALRQDLIQIPYAGTGPALRELQAGRVDLMCDQTTNTAGPIRGGGIAALGVAARRRLPGLATVPALHELGLAGVELSIWHGLFAPAGTPPTVVDHLAGRLAAALGSAGFQAEMAGADVVVATPASATPAALAALLAHETARWTPILRRAGHHAD